MTDEPLEEIRPEPPVPIIPEPPTLPAPIIPDEPEWLDPEPEDPDPEPEPSDPEPEPEPEPSDPEPELYDPTGDESYSGPNPTAPEPEEPDPIELIQETFTRFAVVDASDRVVRHGTSRVDMMPFQAMAGEQTYGLDDYSPVSSSAWRRDPETFAWIRDPMEVPLEHLRAKLAIQVDTQAETCRLLYLTTGSGQSLEYSATEAEARSYLRARGQVAEGDPDPYSASLYPFLAAEIDALADVYGVPPPPAYVAAEVIVQADAWASVGSEIKRLRRGAKMRIEAAATHAEIRSAANVSWPRP